MKRRMPFLICSRQKSFFEKSISFNGRNAKIQIRVLVRPLAFKGC